MNDCLKTLMLCSQDHFHLLPNKMQLSPQKLCTIEGVKLPGRRSPSTGVTVEGTSGRRSCYVEWPNSSPRFRPKCSCSNHPGSARCSRHGYMVPSQKSRKGSANKEILRRALAPPNRRMSLRWWNFRPTPSRLSNMSMAQDAGVATLS